MLSLASVWLPIVVSTVAIFIASSVIWMVLPWHQKEWRGLDQKEEGARSALRGLTPGLYHLPHCQNWAEMRSPEFQRKMSEGPMAFITVVPNGMPNMGRQMGSWIALILVVVGAVNWGLVGVAQFDLVAALFGPASGLSRIVYSLVGLAGVALLAMFEDVEIMRQIVQDAVNGAYRNLTAVHSPHKIKLSDLSSRGQAGPTRAPSSPRPPGSCAPSRSWGRRRCSSWAAGSSSTAGSPSIT